MGICVVTDEHFIYVHVLILHVIFLCDFLQSDTKIVDCRLFITYITKLYSECYNVGSADSVLYFAHVN